MRHSAHEEWQRRTRDGKPRRLAPRTRKRRQAAWNVDGRMEQVFSCIVRYKKAHDGNAPTIREIMAMTGISSTSLVANYLQRLEADGRIRLNGHGAYRSIEVVGARWVYDKGSRG